MFSKRSEYASEEEYGNTKDYDTEDIWICFFQCKLLQNKNVFSLLPYPERRFITMWDHSHLNAGHIIEDFQQTLKNINSVYYFL